MAVMSTHSVPWRERAASAVAYIRKVPAPLRAIFVISLGVSLVGAFFDTSLVSLLGVGLAGAVAMGQEKGSK